MKRHFAQLMSRLLTPEFEHSVKVQSLTRRSENLFACNGIVQRGAGTFALDPATECIIFKLFSHGYFNKLGATIPTPAIHADSGGNIDHLLKFSLLWPVGVLNKELGKSSEQR
jgi:hypothetical protein